MNPQHKLAYLAQKVLASPAVAVRIARNFKNGSKIVVYFFLEKLENRVDVEKKKCHDLGPEI